MKTLKTLDPFLVIDNGNFILLDLVDENDVYHKEIEVKEALSKANEAGLDLVCFSGKTENHNPLCKMIDYGKWKYQKEKKRKKQRSQKHEVKEIRFSPTINDNDVNHKIKHAKEFIDNGHELNFTMRLRRRISREVANDKINEIIKKCEDFTTVISIKREPRLISVKLTKNKEYKK